MMLFTFGAALNLSGLARLRFNANVKEVYFPDRLRVDPTGVGSSPINSDFKSVDRLIHLLFFIFYNAG